MQKQENIFPDKQRKLLFINPPHRMKTIPDFSDCEGLYSTFIKSLARFGLARQFVKRNQAPSVLCMITAKRASEQWRGFDVGVAFTREECRRPYWSLKSHLAQLQQPAPAETDKQVNTTSVASYSHGPLKCGHQAPFTDNFTVMIPHRFMMVQTLKMLCRTSPWVADLCLGGSLVWYYCPIKQNSRSDQCLDVYLGQNWKSMWGGGCYGTCLSVFVQCMSVEFWSTLEQGKVLMW